jgi:hypothetical protein
LSYFDLSDGLGYVVGAGSGGGGGGGLSSSYFLSLQSLHSLIFSRVCLSRKQKPLTWLLGGGGDYKRLDSPMFLLLMGNTS